MQRYSSVWKQERNASTIFCGKKNKRAECVVVLFIACSIFMFPEGNQNLGHPAII
jgi:hypothetical protein